MKKAAFIRKLLMGFFCIAVFGILPLQTAAVGSALEDGGEEEKKVKEIQIPREDFHFDYGPGGETVKNRAMRSFIAKRWITVGQEEGFKEVANLIGRYRFNIAGGCNTDCAPHGIIGYEMPGYNLSLIHILCRRDVEEIKEKLEKNKIFCAVPLVWRYSDLMKEMKKEILPEDIIHLSFRFIAGPPKRYLDTSPWMLEKKTAGSGSCLLYTSRCV